MEEVHQDRTGALAAPINAKVYEGRVARIHEEQNPLIYQWGNEYRDSAGLQEIADQLQSSKPYTLLHPEDLISKGTKADVVGQVIGARIDGDHVIARILVTDDRAIGAIASGMHELSLGYTSSLDHKRRQRNIKVDHLAMVPKARCGPTCALRADCGDNVSCTCVNKTISYKLGSVSDQHITDSSPAGQTPTLTPVPKPDSRNIVMDELSKKLADALAEAASQKARADQLDVELKTAKSALVTAQVDKTNAEAALSNEKKLVVDAVARADQAKLDADKAIDKAKMDADAAISSAAMARAQLLTEAAQILGAKDDKGALIDRSKMTDQAIQIAVIKHVDNLEIESTEDPMYIKGVYRGSLSRADAASASRAAALTTLADTRKDAKKIVNKPAVSPARQLELDAKNSMTSN